MQTGDLKTKQNIAKEVVDDRGVVGTNWLDFLLLAIIGWSAFVGLRTGLVGGLSRLAGTILGLVAALNFYRPLADMVNLKWDLVSAIGGKMPASSRGTNGLSDPIDAWFPSQEPAQALQGLGESLAGSVASGILDVLCFVTLFLVVSWGVKALGSLLANVAKIFFLGPVDRAGGVLFGTAKGLLVSMILVALTNSLQIPAAFLSSDNSSSTISLAMQTSILAPYFINALVVLNVSFPGWGI